jgi:predicted dehydrogenase
VDEQSAIILGHDSGELATIYCAVLATTFQEASIMGTEGRIKIHGPWWKGKSITVMRDNNKDDFLEFPYEGTGFQFEAEEFMRLLREGEKESKIMPLDETLSIMKTMDTVRAMWGLKYPVE